MSQPGVFICPSCQAVVRSENSSTEGLVCGECQFEFGGSAGGDQRDKIKALPGSSSSAEGVGVTRDLTAKKAPIVRVPKSSQAPPIVAKPYQEAVLEEPPERNRGEILLPDGRTKIRKRRKKTKKEKNKPMILFLMGWLFIVVIVFALFFTKDKNKPTDGDDDRPVDYTAVRDREFVEAHREELARLFNEYVFSPTVEGREQFIGRSSELALPYARYYREHSFVVPEAPIQVARTNVIEVSKDPLTLAIEQVWIDGKENAFGTVHYFDGQGWKLDWEAYAPHSSMSWARFQADLGDSEGVFRLLVRKRNSSDESKRFSLSFYRPPIFGEADKGFLKTESPEVEVKSDSKIGVRFLELWKDFKDGKRVFNSMLPLLDPDGFMRITVKLAWEDIEGRDEKRLVLKEIIEPAWYGGFIRDRYQREENESTEGAEKEESDAN